MKPTIKKINGYRIFLDEKLGKGAFGEVFKGQQEQTKNLCAVKILNKTNINADAYLKAALISEIKIMKSVKSDNIVGFYDVMESSNNYYIIQELCDTDLEKYLKSVPNHILDEAEAIKILTEICNGFLTLVKEGILHRDLKPANILISKKSVRIGDFGFAKKTIGTLMNKTAVGTPLYMSVELLKSEPYTSKCDIWALGFIFYEMLHGKTPWIAGSEFQLIKNIENIPLKIDPKLNSLTINFLQSTLKVYEKDRISWDDLFKHPIFGYYFHKEIANNSYEQLENKYKKIMIDIRFQVNSNNLDLTKLWHNLGFKKELKEEEFKKFMTCILPNIAQDELEYFFIKMDKNKDKEISIPELKSEFAKYNIPLTSTFVDGIPFLLKKIVSVEDDEETSVHQSFEKHDEQLHFEAKVNRAFKKMDETLTKKKLTLFDVFRAYDGDKNGQLNVLEFGKILKKLNPQFYQEEIDAIFKLVDADKSGTIEFDELNSYFSKITGVPENINVPAEYYNSKMQRESLFYKSQH